MWYALKRHKNAKDVPGFSSLDKSGREEVLKLCGRGGGGSGGNADDDDNEDAVMEVRSGEERKKRTTKRCE